MNNRTRFEQRTITLDEAATLYATGEAILPKNQRKNKDRLRSASQLLGACIDNVRRYKDYYGDEASCGIGKSGVSFRLWCETINVAIAIYNGVMYIVEGGHRFYWLCLILGYILGLNPAKSSGSSKIKVPMDCGNATISKNVRDCVGKTFFDLTPEEQEMIKNIPVTMHVYHVDGSKEYFNSECKRIFHLWNCGKAITTMEDAHNDYGDDPFFSMIEKAIDSAFNNDTNGPFKNVKNFSDISKISKPNNLKSAVIRLVCPEDSKFTGAKGNIIAAVEKFENKSKKEQKETLSKVFQALITAYNILPPTPKTNIYAMTAYAILEGQVSEASIENILKDDESKDRFMGIFTSNIKELHAPKGKSWEEHIYSTSHDKRRMRATTPLLKAVAEFEK